MCKLRFHCFPNPLSHTQTRTHDEDALARFKLTHALQLFCLWRYAMFLFRAPLFLRFLSHTSTFTARVPSRADKSPLGLPGSTHLQLSFPPSVSRPFYSLAMLLARIAPVLLSSTSLRSFPSPSSHRYGDLAVAQSKAMLLSAPPPAFFTSVFAHLGGCTTCYTFICVAPSGFLISIQTRSFSVRLSASACSQHFCWCFCISRSIFNSTFTWPLHLQVAKSLLTRFSLQFRKRFYLSVNGFIRYLAEYWQSDIQYRPNVFVLSSKPSWIHFPNPRWESWRISSVLQRGSC